MKYKDYKWRQEHPESVIEELREEVEQSEVSQQEELEALQEYVEICRTKVLALESQLTDIQAKMAVLDERMLAAEARHLKAMDSMAHLAEMILRQIGIKEPGVTVREFMSR